MYSFVPLGFCNWTTSRVGLLGERVSGGEAGRVGLLGRLGIEVLALLCELLLFSFAIEEHMKEFVGK